MLDCPLPATHCPTATTAVGRQECSCLLGCLSCSYLSHADALSQPISLLLIIIQHLSLLSCTGNTPLSLATAGGHDEVVKLLEPHTQAEATPAAPDDSFFPAEKFDQVRPGYLFKMGDQVRNSLYSPVSSLLACSHPRSSALSVSSLLAYSQPLSSAFRGLGTTRTYQLWLQLLSRRL